MKNKIYIGISIFLLIFILFIGVKQSRTQSVQNILILEEEMVLPTLKEIINEKQLPQLKEILQKYKEGLKENKNQLDEKEKSKILRNAATSIGYLESLVNDPTQTDIPTEEDLRKLEEEKEKADEENAKIIDKMSKEDPQQVEEIEKEIEKAKKQMEKQKYPFMEYKKSVLEELYEITDILQNQPTLNLPDIQEGNQQNLTEKEE